MQILHFFGIFLAVPTGFEPVLPGWKPGVLTWLDDGSEKVAEEGLEPSIPWAQDFKSCVYTNSTTQP